MNLDYILIRSSRRTLSISITKDGDTLVRAPLRYSGEKIEIFLREKALWIHKYRKRTEERNIQIETDRWHYYLFGKRYEVADASHEEIQKISKDTLRDYIHDRLPSLTSGKTLGRDIANIRINSARTRWGSCSSRGNLSFSCRLAAYPKETIDAVIIHELAHLTHADHSKKFWSLVYEWMPEYEIYISHLKKSPQEEVS